MRSRRRGGALEADDADSYYVSMTDMMIGIVFIFIIMLAYFALQFRSTTASLTGAKDAQTTALLHIATSLQPKTINAEIDEKTHILCVPGTALGDEDTARHCFAYSGSTPHAAATPQDMALAERASLVGQLEGDLDSAKLSASGDAANGNLGFPADQIFLPNSTTLSAGGQAITQKVAAILAQRLSCYAYGAGAAADCDKSTIRVARVNIVTSANFDAFTDQGRAQAALALQRSVAFHDALIRAQATLGQLRSGPVDQGGQPLLQVASFGQSQTALLAANGSQNVTIAFDMQVPPSN